MVIVCLKKLFMLRVQVGGFFFVIDMEKELEFLVMWNVVGNSVLLMLLQFLLFGKILFKIVQFDNVDDDDDDDDGNDCIFFKEWQLVEMISLRCIIVVVVVNENGIFYSVWKLVKDNGIFFNVFLLKGSICIFFIGYSFIVEMSDDVCLFFFIYRDIIDEVFLFVFERNVEEDQYEDDSENGLYEDCFEDVVKN